ncbi:class I SAM-dependent methyltransferase [Erythrobacter sp. W53]|uniref:class I SAM-dependent methyltransferase n=1 Tax=Erythrobacter sp. W53 TaxID=3425947 RepID=UPI003D767C98
MRKLTHVIAPLAALAMATGCSQAEVEEPAGEESAVSDVALDEVLASDLRAEDRERDQYRNPAETLAFFQLAPDQTIIEYAPGGGWYTRILAPYVAENGQYIAVSFPAEAAISLGEDFVARVRGFAETFSTDQSEALNIPAEKLPYYSGNAIPDELDGTVDRILMIRMMHNLKRWDIDESEIAALRDTLKDDGMLGVVQHRAKADAPDEYVDGNAGYLKQDEMVAFFEANGFELVDTSEVNANPKDPANWEGGVWTLPPSFGFGSQSEEEIAEHTAIGETDRMTLLFKKAG